MKLSSVTVTYSVNGKEFVSYSAENEHYTVKYEVKEDSFKAAICPKTKITLKKVDAVFAYAYGENDKFFANGYQAWTTSRELSKSDKMRDIIPIAVGRLRKLAGISADCRFVKFPKNAGEFFSHTYTYIKNNDSFFLVGSLSERQGFTVIYADMNRNLLTLSKDVEGVTTEDEYDLFDVVFFSGKYNDVFDKYFSAMNLRKPRIDHMSGYTSWYNYFQKIDEKIILRDLNALDKVKDSVSVFQIDDGYETFVGDWLDENPEKFPNGMKYIADEVHKKGYLAGIWIAPFNLQRASRMYKEHPDWVIKDEKGAPVLGCFGWGGAYTMDIYNEECRAYMKKFFDVILNEWGYDMVKLDFLYSQCMYPRNNKSRGTIMCEAMAFLRECCGDKLILGCGVHHGASFGYVDACRTGCDVDLKYSGKYYDKLHVNNEIPSAKNSITNAVFRRHLDKRAFCNDPDVFFMRYSNLEFTREQKLLLCGINYIFGNVLFVSDNAEEYNDKDIEVIKKAFSKEKPEVISVDERKRNKFVVELLCEGERKTLVFDLITGESNISEILSFPKY